MERTAGTGAKRILRRALVLALFGFGWLLCAAGPASAATGGPDDSGRPVIEVDLPGLAATVDHTLRSLARTVGDAPRTVHRAIEAASPAVAVAASPEAAHGAVPPRFENTRVESKGTGRPGGLVRKTARPGGRKHLARAAVRPAAARTVRPATGRRTTVRHTTIHLAHHQERIPAPIAPAAPESLTVGSAAQSSGAAGPAVPLIPGDGSRGPSFARDEARHTAPEPATVPRGLPDCTPD